MLIAPSLLDGLMELYPRTSVAPINLTDTTVTVVCDGSNLNVGYHMYQDGRTRLFADTILCPPNLSWFPSGQWHDDEPSVNPAVDAYQVRLVTTLEGAFNQPNNNNWNTIPGAGLLIADSESATNVPYTSVGIFEIRRVDTPAVTLGRWQVTLRGRKTPFVSGYTQP